MSNLMGWFALASSVANVISSGLMLAATIRHQRRSSAEPTN